MIRRPAWPCSTTSSDDGASEIMFVDRRFLSCCRCLFCFMHTVYLQRAVRFLLGGGLERWDGELLRACVCPFVPDKEVTDTIKK